MAQDIHAHGDIKIGNLPLNYIDEDGCRWIVQDVTGWWETPPAIIPEDERPYNEDGNYWTAGRYGPRTIQINGVVIPPPRASEREAQRIISRARDKINQEINLVRRTGILSFAEVDATRQIEVQLLGQPLIATADGSNVLHFDLQFIASDPRKHSVSRKVHSATMRQVGVGGLKFPRLYPRKYGPSSGTNRVHVKNEGDTYTYGTFRISGPIRNPRVDHAESGEFIKLNLELGEDDYVDIDMQNKTVVLNNAVSRVANLDFDSTWFSFQPGDNTLLFTGTVPVVPQEGWAAATNLVTNPSIEAATGADVVVHQNFMPDPSFKATDTVLAVTRTNIADNPVLMPEREEFVNLVSNPAGRNTSGTVTIKENHVPGFYGWNQADHDNVEVISPSHMRFLGSATGFNMPNRLAVSSGATVRIRAEARSDTLRDGYDNAGLHSNTYFDVPGGGGTARNFPADGEWHVVEWTRAVPEGATEAYIGFMTSSSYSSPTYELRNLQVWVGDDDPGPYWDGDSVSDDPDMWYEWTGTPGASTSRLVAPKPVGWTGYQAILYYSASRDAVAVRVTDLDDAPRAVFRFDAQEGALAVAQVEIDGAAEFYLRVHSSRHSTPETISGSGTLRAYFSGTVINMGVGATGGLSVGDTFYTRLAHYPTDSDIPYFDGDMADGDPVEYLWTGEDNASPSVKSIRTLPGFEAAPDTDVISSSEWTVSGDYSLKIVPLSEENNDTYVDITPSRGFVPGQRYTISADYFENTSLQGELHEHARSIVLTHSEGTVKATASESGQRVTLLTTIPGTAEDIRLLLYNGSKINFSRGLDGEANVNEGAVYWDNISIIPGEARSDFFYYGSESPNAVYELRDGVSVELKQSSPRWRATNGSVAYIDHADTSDLVAEFVVGSEVETTMPITIPEGAEAVTIGAMITASAETLVTPNIILEDEGTISGGEVKIPGGVETMIRATIPTLDNSFRVGFAFSIGGANTDPLTIVRINSVVVAEGRYTGPYFDLDEGLTGFDMRTSGGVIQAVAKTAPGYSAAPQAEVYQTREWSKEGQYGLAVQRKDSTLSVDSTYAELTSPAWSNLTSGDYTMYATVFAQPGDYKSGPEARTIEVVDNGTGEVFRSVQAPVGELTTLVLKFTKSTNSGHIRLISNALNGEKVFWDGILIVRGDYSDRYFDGDTPEASWTGARHASTSSQSAKIDIPAPALFSEHRDSWIR